MITVSHLTVYDVRHLGILKSEQTPKFGNFQAKLVEIRVEKIHLQIGTQCSN